jgi:nicotinamidase-related amidase
MKHLISLSCCTTVLAATVIAAIATLPGQANDITAEWATVKQPPVPVLKPVTVDPKTTALLILDLMKVNCGPSPRCTSTVPIVKKLMDAARANNMMVLYTLVGGPNPSPADIVDEGIAPHAGESVAPGLMVPLQRADGTVVPFQGPDKFLGSDLEKRLKDRGIKTVIVTGTSAQGAVVGTSSGSAQRGYKVVVPVDGMSAEDAYQEQYAAWHLYKGGPAVVIANVTLTRSDLIKFAN